jgi:hypothetical protein
MLTLNRIGSAQVETDLSVRRQRFVTSARIGKIALFELVDCDGFGEAPPDSAVEAD